MKKPVYLTCATCAFLQLINDAQVIALQPDKRPDCEQKKVESLKRPEPGREEKRRVRPRSDLPVATSVDYRFVNKLKAMSSLVYDYSTLVAADKTGLKALEQKGEFALFFRGTSREESNFAGMVNKIGNRLIITFPGTRTDRPVSSVDKAANIHYKGDDGGFLESVEGDGFVHAGFAKEVMEFWPNLSACIARFSGYNEVFFTGHSKGGGVALLAALKYAYEHHDEMVRCPNFVKVFTFAAPQVFSKESAETFHGNLEDRNVICIRKSLDPFIGLSEMFSFVPVGTQATAALTGINPHSLDGFSDDELRHIIEQIQENDRKGAYRDLAATSKNNV